MKLIENAAKTSETSKAEIILCHGCHRHWLWGRRKWSSLKFSAETSSPSENANTSKFASVFILIFICFMFISWFVVFITTLNPRWWWSSSWLPLPLFCICTFLPRHHQKVILIFFPRKISDLSLVSNFKFHCFNVITHFNLLFHGT